MEPLFFGRPTSKSAGYQPQKQPSMKKTSITHPLRIDVVSPGNGFGRIGMTQVKAGRH